MTTTYTSELKEFKDSITSRKLKLVKFIKNHDNVGRIRMEIRIEDDEEQIKLITGQ